MALALVAVAVAATAAWGKPDDERLSTTLLGRLEPGGEPRLAVRWDGPPGALLEVWADLDGDGALSAHELVVAGRPLEPGIEVVELEIPAEAYVVPQPRLWVRAGVQGPAEASCTAKGRLEEPRQDGCAWQPGFTAVDFHARVRALAVLDDGSGPALYVGGVFLYAGGVTVNNVAKWDGSAWSFLAGPDGTGMNGAVYALGAFDLGAGPALYAGGFFTSAGGVEVNYVARWDGTAWSALSGPSGTGMDSTVYSLAVFDDGSGPALYAGGWFTTAGGVTVNRIAKWDGTAWSALSGPSGTGMNGTVFALSVFDDGSGPALYAGGGFSTAGGLTVSYIAKWDGTAWSALSGPSGTGTSGTVSALVVFDDGSGPALCAGGVFVYAGGVTVNYVAKWDGNAWSDLSGPSGTGMDNHVWALAVFDDGSGQALYAGGSFGTAGGVMVNYVARWDGTAWSALSGPSGTGMDAAVTALAVFDDGSGQALYAGGNFTAAGGVSVGGIARWDGAAWSAVGTPPGTGMDGVVQALAVWDDNSGPALYAAGEFFAAGRVGVNRIGRWDGTAWSALSGPSGTGVDATVYSLAVFDDGSGPALYAGGDFVTAGGVMVNYVARWDGTAWSALSGPSGTGVSTTVYALAVYDDGTGPALYAGGDFVTAGGVTVYYIARWDGTAWSDLSGPSATGMNDAVYALAVFDDGSGPALYAGGGFASAGGAWVYYIARWDGTAWSGLSGPSATGMNSTVYSLAVYDDGSGPALYAGGWFSTAGGVTVEFIGKWDGTAWSALSGPSGTGMDSPVYALAVKEDRSSPALYAGGDFTTAGGVAVDYVARWDGSAWSALSGPSGTGMDDYVSALAVFDDGSGPVVYAGGGFTHAGGVPSNYIAAWRCDPSFLFGDGFESGNTSAWSVTIP